jgi:hypothetical protein
MEKRLKRDFERKIKALKKKAEEFRKQGDISRAENCLFLAKYLEDFLASV